MVPDERAAQTFTGEVTSAREDGAGTGEGGASTRDPRPVPRAAQTPPTGEKCPKCDGTGKVPYRHWTCSLCGGSGVVARD